MFHTKVGTLWSSLDTKFSLMPSKHAEFWSLGFFFTDTFLLVLFWYSKVEQMNKYIFLKFWLLSTFLSREETINYEEISTAQGHCTAEWSWRYRSYIRDLHIRTQKRAAFNHLCSWIPALCWARTRAPMGHIRSSLSTKTFTTIKGYKPGNNQESGVQMNIQKKGTLHSEKSPLNKWQ